MADEARKPTGESGRGGATKLLALVAGSFAAGTSAGVVSSKLSSGESVLPLRTFEWALEHGIAGLLLIIVFIAGWVIWRQQGEIKAIAEGRHQERVALEREYRDKVEALLREQVKITQKTGTLVSQTNEVLRSLNLVVDENEAGEDDNGGH